MDGIELAHKCLNKAEQQGFDTLQAKRFILDYLASFGATPGETLVYEAEARGLIAHDARAFGGIFGNLSRTGQIVCLRSDLPRKRGHGTTGGKLWALGKEV